MSKILQGDCIEQMKELEENSIDLVITSPPYNVGIEYDEYDDELGVEEYSDFLKVVFNQVDRVVKEKGRVCINHSLKNQDGIVDLPSLIKEIATSIGWKQRFEIIWNKGQSESSSAWGSWRSPSSPRPIFNHEYIFVFDVGEGKRESEKTIPKEEFMRLVKSVWNIKPKTNSDHPAAFPEEIPERLLKLNTYEEEVVLDPFMGSGTTLVACEKLNRKGIGIELSEKYINMAKERLSNIEKHEENQNSVFQY